MADEQKNVGQLDSIIRIILGVASIGSIVYYFAGEAFGPWYVLIPIFILVPFFLKTGLTKVCPVMKAMGMSTAKKN